MPLEFPRALTIDEDGRIQVARVPEWLKPEGPQAFCVPLKWKRPVALPPGRELEAWIVWNSVGKEGLGWRVEPAAVLAGDGEDEINYEQKSLMFQVRYDSKGRLCCAGLFTNLARVSGRTIWVSAEKGSIVLWSNFAFQSAYGVRPAT